MTKKEACQILNIPETDISVHILNLRIKEFHPDTATSPTKKRQWKPAFEAYRFLKDGLDSTSAVEMTVDGRPLSELGKGFPHRNACDCTICNGKGYTSEHNVVVYDPCPTCKGSGALMDDPDGRIIPAKYLGRRAHFCYDCRGSGENLSSEREITKHYTCLRCKGVGQVEVLNPAFKDLGKMLGGQSDRRSKKD